MVGNQMPTNDGTHGQGVAVDAVRIHPQFFGEDPNQRRGLFGLVTMSWPACALGAKKITSSLMGTSCSRTKAWRAVAD